jgi:Zn-dependent M16 (insulinase) family peptidase
MTVYAAFDLVRSETISEIASDVRLYRHRKTGAEVMSYVNGDENKVFGITFKTPPEDSTGVAHILEHSVLCGSRKYPVKKPFVELIKSSMNTFLNAMTFPDKTAYPVASQNLADFYNLVDVYLDAVFFRWPTRAWFSTR